MRRLGTMDSIRHVALLLLLVGCACALFGVTLGEEEAATVSPSLPTEGFEFLDSFDTPWEERWESSSDSAYGGVFKHDVSEGTEDYGLLIGEKAKKYGLATQLAKEVDLVGKTTVIQYDVRLQKGLDCGGAYLKFLMPQEGWSPSQLRDDSPYSIMFGPDKCGATNKVHFIFRHRNPKSGKYVEHHLKTPPSPPSDKLSHVYTAILYPNSTLQILIDGEVKRTASLMEDFDPAVNPPKEIDDPEDKKPADWVDTVKIADPEAKKPEDWDEDAPMEIEDEEAVIPEGWLVDEPLMVEDPEAIKPEDWDEEEDGEWEAPKVENAKCAEAPGCGEWKRPSKRNPAYKGRWNAPLIENPAYKGPWAPRKIPNPDFFELSVPKIEPIGAIGIEIWTMSDGILFDNIFIGHDIDVSEEVREKTWKVKFETEKKTQETEEKEEDSSVTTGLKSQVFSSIHSLIDRPALAPVRPHLQVAVQHLESNLVLQIIVALGLPVVFIFLIVQCFCASSKKEGALAGASEEETSVAEVKKKDIPLPDDKTESKEEDEQQEPAAAVVQEPAAEAAGAGGRHDTSEEDNAEVEEIVNEPSSGATTTETVGKKSGPQRRTRRA